MREEPEGDDDAAAQDVFPFVHWPFRESGIVEGGDVESMEGGSGHGDVDILRLAGISAIFIAFMFQDVASESDTPAAIYLRHSLSYRLIKLLILKRSERYQRLSPELIDNRFHLSPIALR